MISKYEQGDLAEFRAFCKAATAAQLRAIHVKELLARRQSYADIAKSVMAERGMYIVSGTISMKPKPRFNRVQPDRPQPPRGEDDFYISAEDLGRIEMLALCGQIEPARAFALQLISEAIGRTL